MMQEVSETFESRKGSLDDILFKLPSELKSVLKSINVLSHVQAIAGRRFNVNRSVLKVSIS